MGGNTRISPNERALRQPAFRLQLTGGARRLRKCDAIITFSVITVKSLTSILGGHRRHDIGSFVTNLRPNCLQFAHSQLRAISALASLWPEPLLATAATNQDGRDTHDRCLLIFIALEACQLFGVAPTPAIAT